MKKKAEKGENKYINHYKLANIDYNYSYQI